MAVSRERRHRTLDERLELHSRVHELRSRSLRIGEIAVLLGMSKRDVSYWLRVEKPCRETYVPDLSPGPELSYLVGAYLGDGRTAGEQDKKVRFNVADIEFALLLNDLIAKVLSTSAKTVKFERGFYNVNYDSAVLYDFLQQPLAKLLSIIDRWPNSFLRGFFDAEGYVSPILDHRGQNFNGIVVGAANTSFEYLVLVEKLLTSLGIHSKFISTNRRGETMTIRGNTFVRKHDVSHVVIKKLSDVEAYSAAIGFSIRQKENKLLDMMQARTELNRKEAYLWFVANYHLRNHKWIKTSV